MMSATGTTHSTMNALEPMSRQTLPTSNAVTKLIHCGSVGHERPMGLRSAGCSAAGAAGAFDPAATCPSGFHLISQGIDALRIRAELAEAARHTLDLQYYTLHEDTTTSLLLWRILRAAGRGVRVRLLLDDLYAALFGKGK